MLKVALLHILLRNFFSAQTLPHGVLEHKPRNSRSCNFSCRANNLFTSSVNHTKINLSGEGRLPPLALCWSISTDLGKADEHSVRCVLTERDNAGCRVKNCFLPCFLHTPSSPWNILLPELKFRRNFCSQDLTHCEFPLLLSTAPQARNRSTFRTTSCWHNLGQITAAVPDKVLQQLFAFSLPLAAEITQLCGSLSALWQINSWCASAHKHHFIMMGQAETCSWEQGSPSLAGFYTSRLA